MLEKNKIKNRNEIKTTFEIKSSKAKLFCNDIIFIAYIPLGILYTQIGTDR